MVEKVFTVVTQELASPMIKIFASDRDMVMVSAQNGDEVTSFLVTKEEAQTNYPIGRLVNVKIDPISEEST